MSFVIAMVFMPIAFITIAHAQDANDPTVFMVSYLDVTPASRDAAAACCASWRPPAARIGEGRYEVLQRGRPVQPVRDRRDLERPEGYDAHAASAHVKKFRQQVKPHLVSPIDERPYVTLAADPKDGAAIPRGSAVAISHVDVAPPKKDDGVAALKALADPTRKDNGNLRFDAYQQKTRPNHFTVIEVWRNQKAVDAHETDTHTKDFRKVLGSATGALYDQRWYKAI